jgi:hypothetical protein
MRAAEEKSDERVALLVADSRARETAFGTIVMPMQRGSAPASWPAVIRRSDLGETDREPRPRSSSIRTSASSPKQWRDPGRPEHERNRAAPALPAKVATAAELCRALAGRGGGLRRDVRRGDPVRARLAQRYVARGRG